MNLTFAPEITKECFDWCKTQSFIHERNLEVQELSILALALISLAIHNFIMNHWDFVQKKTELTDNQLERLCKATSYLPFIMIAMYIIYFLIT